MAQIVQARKLLPKTEREIVRFPSSMRPRLLFIIDAEEEFNWNEPFSRDNRTVKSMSAQVKAHRIFERFGVRPTYAVDYPVAHQEDGFLPLMELARSGACDIGAQLHAWVTPPFEEEISVRNSFANNLPSDLERRKIECLTRIIEDNLDCKPTLYRAGRYGAGDSTPQILQDLGYEIDCSVLPGRSTVEMAPDYTEFPSTLYWLGSNKSILEIPVTIGDVGAARRVGSKAGEVFDSALGRNLKFGSIAARLGILTRVRLTPEGSSIAEAKRLTRALLADGHRVFVVSYHTPSLEPGHTPYVQTARDLEGFLYWLEAYCDFFMADALGVPSTPMATRRLALERDTD